MSNGNVLSDLWAKRLQQMWKWQRSLRGGGALTIVNKEDCVSMSVAVGPRGRPGTSIAEADVVTVTLEQDNIGSAVDPASSITYTVKDRATGAIISTEESPIDREHPDVEAVAAVVGRWLKSDPAAGGEGVLLRAFETYPTGPCGS